MEIDNKGDLTHYINFHEFMDIWKICAKKPGLKLNSFIYSVTR